MVNRWTMPTPSSSATIASRSASVISHLAVGQLLEPGERLVQRVALHVQAHLLQRVGERVAAGVLAQHDLRGLLADGRRRR